LGCAEERAGLEVPLLVLVNHWLPAFAGLCSGTPINQRPGRPARVGLAS
jgi:hypothetical protein